MYSTITCGIRETPIYAKLIGRGVIYPKVAVIYVADHLDVIGPATA